MTFQSNARFIGAVMGSWNGDETTYDGDIHLSKKSSEKTWGRKEVEEMGKEKKCPLFRQPGGLGFGKGIGYCDIDGGSTTCEGDVKFCERPDALKQYLQRKLSDFEKKENKGE